MNNLKREDSTIRKDILETLDRVFPGNVIEMWGGMEESYLEDVYEKLSAKLHKIKTAHLDYERDWRGEEIYGGYFNHSPGWSYEEEDFDELPVTDDLSYSHHLFFFSLKDRRFHFEYEGETIDDDNNEVKIVGQGTIGCSVGICLLAPFAVIVPNSMRVDEDGSRTIPDIFTNDFDYTGKPVDMEGYIRQLSGEEGVQAVRELSDRIDSVLKSCGIPILPDVEAEKSVPWLKPAEEVIDPLPGETIKLKDAFFFRYF